MDATTEHDTTGLAAALVAAYVSKNSLPAAELGNLLTQVHAAFVGLSSPGMAASAEQHEKASPAQIRKSITVDALISFVDGKPYKTLKRHLTTHGLDFATYRERYGLPADYPTVAASYAAKRSELAKSIGLGSRRKAAAKAAAPSATVSEKPKGAKRPRRVA